MSWTHGSKTMNIRLTASRQTPSFGILLERFSVAALATSSFRSYLLRLKVIMLISPRKQYLITKSSVWATCNVTINMAQGVVRIRLKNKHNVQLSDSLGIAGFYPNQINPNRLVLPNGTCKSHSPSNTISYYLAIFCVGLHICVCFDSQPNWMFAASFN